jgi:replicative DNA helicase
LAARDSAKEINGVATELKQRGVIRDTINAGEEIGATAKETAQTVRETVKRNQTSTVEPSTERTTPA